MATELVFPLEEAPSKGDLLDVVEGVACLRAGADVVEVRDVDAGFERAAGVVALEVGVEDRGAILEGVEVLGWAAVGLEAATAAGFEGARDVGVEGRLGFDFAGNAGRLVGVAAREDGFLPLDDRGLLFAAVEESKLFDFGSCCRKQCKMLSLN